MKKRFVLIALTMLLVLFAFVIAEAEIVDSGSCGKYLTWTLDDEGTLTISGTGYMTSTPWSEKTIKKLVLPSGLSSICDYAFKGKSMTSVVIPDTVESLGIDAFMSCKSLTSVTIPKSIKSYEYGVFAGCTALSEVKLEDGLECLGGQMFRWCESIETISMPDSMKSIGYCAFSDCTGLKSITIPGKVSEIEWATFDNCTGLSSVTIQDGVEQVSREAFKGCTSLTSIKIPKSVTSIGDSAFLNCYNLESIDIEGYTSVGTDAFKGCYELVSISILECCSDAIKNIKEGGFEKALKLKPHTLTKTDQVDPTCTETGVEAYWQCEICKKLFSDAEGKNQIENPVVIPAAGHIEAIDAAVEATCTATGLTEGKHCSVCGVVLESQEITPVLGHDWDEGTVTKEATYSEDGVLTFTCKRCGDTYESVISIKIPIGKSGWVQNADYSWSYGDKNGNAVVGPLNDNGTLYCFDETGRMITGWRMVLGKWYYAQDSGVLYNSGWMDVNGIWYYFNTDGSMAVGWLYDGGVWYYMSAEGPMKIGWVEDEGKWYFFADSGAMQTGWQLSGSTWYLLKSSGEMATGWTYDSGAWYFFEDSGVMKTGWFEDREAEKALPEGQKRAIWYWFDDGGAMAKGWKEINGQWEMFNDSGEWLYTWDGK